MFNIKKIGNFIGIFLLFYLSSLIYLIPLGIFKISYNSLTIFEQSVLMLCSNLFVATILYVIYSDYLEEKFKDFKKNFGKYTDIAIKSWVIGLIIMFVCNALIVKFSPSKEAINEQNVQQIIQNTPLMAFIMTSIFAPFNEEMIFRKALKDTTNDNMIYILLSALIFGYLHVTNSNSLYDFLYIIPYGALGAAFAYISVKTDNVYSSILVHFVHNSILTIFSIISLL